MTTSVNRRVGLRHEIVLLAIGSEVLDFVRDTAVMHLPVRRLDEPKLVNSGEGAHRTNQADVWAFRRLNWADASIMRRVNVAHFETGTLPTQSPGSEG